MLRRVRGFLLWVWGAAPEAGFRAAIIATPAFWTITAVVIVVSSVDFALHHSSGMGLFTYYLGDSTAHMAQGQIWRALTWTLVNPAVGGGWREVSGLEHLAYNVVGLVLAGPRAEQAFGSRRFVVLFAVAAICSTAAMTVGRPLSWGYGGGTSGAMFGVAGSVFVLAYLGRNASPSERRFFVLAWSLVGLAALTSLPSPAVSNYAHLGGFLAGVALAGVWKGGWLKLPRPGVAAVTMLTLGAVLVSAGKCAFVRRVDSEVVAEIPVSRAPVLVELAFGSVWVNGDGKGPLIRIDKDTNRVVANIKARTFGGMVAVGGSLWVASAKAVLEIDPKANRVRSRIDLRGDGPWGLAAEGGVLWAALPDRDSIARIDIRTRHVTETKVGRRPFAVAAAAGGVWATSYDGRRISQLDRKSGKVVRDARYDFRPYWIEFVRGSLWVGEQGGVARVDADTLKVIEHIDVGQDVWQMAVDVEGQLWCAERWGFGVSQIDTRSNKVVRRVHVGMRQPLGIAAEEDAWIADAVKREVLYAQL